VSWLEGTGDQEFTPRNSMRRKLTSSMVALIHRVSNNRVNPAKAIPQ